MHTSVGGRRGVRHAPILLVALAGIAVLIGAPLAGWPTVVRLPAVLVPAIALMVVILRPWRWNPAERRTFVEWTPSGRVIWAGAIVVGALLLWLVLTRFQSGHVNAVDFTVYYDRPCFQTLQGRLLFVETADAQTVSQQSAFAHHAYWMLLPVCSLYALRATPYWLLLLSIVSVTAGAVYVLRAMQASGAGGVLATATALTFVVNDNTARTLSHGFHPEVCYAWFIAWLLDAGLRGKRWQFVVAALASVLVKEDAVLPLLAGSVSLGLYRFRQIKSVDRAVFLVLPVVLAVANLGLYYGVVLPRVTPDGLPAYATFWASYGPTPFRALVGMLAQPWSVGLSIVRSGFFSTVLLPHLCLPVIGWRWVLGIVPIVALYSASDNVQLRAFGYYYAIPLVPFLVMGASFGARALALRVVADRGRAEIVAAALVLLGAVLVGSGNRGYSLRPWSAEIAAVPEALSRLADEKLVLVQSGLYPHAGYDERTQLLTPDTLQQPQYAGAAVLMAPLISAFPFEAGDLSGLRHLSPIRAMPGGLLAIRRPIAGSEEREGAR